MSKPVLLARMAIETEIAAMAEVVRAWEPKLDLDVLHDEPMLYEPDGTLYGVALSLETTLTVRHKSRSVRRGDAIVVPQSVSVDADPEVSLLVIRHEGVPPPHFRERFIQTWGMDHLPLVPSITNGARTEVLPVKSSRFRLAYSVLETATETVRDATEQNLHLLLVLEGKGRLALDGMGEIHLEPDRLALLSTGVTYRVDGPALLGRLILETESTHEARKMAESLRNPLAANPEYHAPT